MEIDEAEFDFSYDDAEDFSLNFCGKTIRGCIWAAEEEKDARVTVIYVHGLAGWLTRNKDVFKVFLDHGYSVVGTDHLGHGRSDGVRCSTSVEEIAEEIVQMINVAKNRFRFNKIFIYGHSLGGLAALQVALLRRTIISKEVSGIIVENPWVSTGPKIGINFGSSLLYYMGSLFCPDHQVPAPLDVCNDDVPQRFLDITKKYDGDACFFSPKLISSVFSSITDVRSMVEVWPKDLKLFIAGSKQDEVVDPNLSHPYFSDLVKFSKKGDVTYKRYNGHHSLTKGASRKAFLTDVIDFIETTKKIHKNMLKM